MSKFSNTLVIDATWFEKEYQGIYSHLFGLFLSPEAVGVWNARDTKLIFVCEDKETVRQLVKNSGLEADVVEVTGRKVPIVYSLKLLFLALKRGTKFDFLFQNYCPILLSRWSNVTIHDVLFLTHPQYFDFSYIIKRKIIFGLSAALSKTVITVSDYSRGAIHEQLICSINKIKIVNNSVAKREILLSTKRNIVCLSRFEPRKNQLLVLKAFVALLREYPDTKLSFIGERTLKYPEFDAFYSSLSADIKSKVSFHKGLPDEVVWKMLCEAALTLYPSKGEGFGMPIIESLSAGTPVIYFENTALAEIKTCFSVVDGAEDKFIEKVIESYNWVYSSPAVTVRDATTRFVRNDWEKSAMQLVDALYV